MAGLERDDPESLVPAGFRHDGLPAGFSGSKKAVMAWAKSRRACCRTIWEPAASHGCSARTCVSWRHCSR